MDELQETQNKLHEEQKKNGNLIAWITILVVALVAAFLWIDQATPSPVRDVNNAIRFLERNK